MAIEVSQFRIQKLVLEVRFAQSFLLWDQAGHIWHQLRSHFPELTLQKTQPNEQRFTLAKQLGSSLLLDRAHVVGNYDLERFSSACAIVFPVIIDRLGVSDLTRIGLRTFFQMKFGSKEEASKFALEHVPSLQRKGKYFNIEGKCLDPEVAWRWEGEATGVLVRLQAVEQKLEMEIPAEFEGIEPINAQQNIVVLDVDYYAHGNTPAAKFAPQALIESWLQVIRRDLGGFISG